MLDEANIIDATAVTSDQTSAAYLNAKARGILLILKVTSAGTGEIDGLEIHAADGQGAYKKMYTLAATANVSTNSTNFFLLYPQATLNATEFAGTPVIGVLPRRFKVVVSHANANAMTYKVSYQTLA